ncbi:hypothetical protein COJ50_06700 [Bacillus cereus]|uniref:Uncharacterized protein n=1 Tax=Bacillus cereus TaxID=1396 RepID=A0A2B1KS98_BACCE|nr:hypothetical protein COJ50_06700 [Bacillus cereus]
MNHSKSFSIIDCHLTNQIFLALIKFFIRNNFFNTKHKLLIMFYCIDLLLFTYVLQLYIFVGISFIYA